MELESGRPRHEQISDWLREKIEEGGYEVDEKLPSEKQLGARFDVSRVTVRRALQPWRTRTTSTAGRAWGRS
jgi:GntR family transcriptional regulator